MKKYVTVAAILAMGMLLRPFETSVMAEENNGELSTDFSDEDEENNTGGETDIPEIEKSEEKEKTKEIEDKKEDKEPEENKSKEENEKEEQDKDQEAKPNPSENKISASEEEGNQAEIKDQDESKKTEENSVSGNDIEPDTNQKEPEADEKEKGQMPDSVIGDDDTASALSVSGNGIIENEGLPKISLQLPQKLEAVIDPWELEEKGQIHSEQYMVRNEGKMPGILTLSFTCRLQEDSQVEIKEDKQGLHSGDTKFIYMEIIFSEDERIVLSEETSVYQAELKPGDEIFFRFAGEVNENAAEEWIDGDIMVDGAYSWDTDENAPDDLSADEKTLLEAEKNGAGMELTVSGNGLPNNSLEEERDSDDVNKTPEEETTGGNTENTEGKEDGETNTDQKEENADGGKDSDEKIPSGIPEAPSEDWGEESPSDNKENSDRGDEEISGGDIETPKEENDKEGEPGNKDSDGLDENAGQDEEASGENTDKTEGEENQKGEMGGNAGEVPDEGEALEDDAPSEDVEPGQNGDREKPEGTGLEEETAINGTFEGAEEE